VRRTRRPWLPKRLQVFRGTDLELELLDPDSTPLVRLFRHSGADWEPPPEEHRGMRVDPPSGHKAAFAVLYTGDNIQTVAIECKVLRSDHLDKYTWATDLAEEYSVVRYAFSAPALFVPIDRRNRALLGLSGSQRKFAGNEPYQAVALELFQRYGNVIHGLSWESFHRNQPGRVYAIWHHHKSTIGLRITTPAPYRPLVDDEEWKEFMAAYPDVEAISPPSRL
jgi:hypothetical protein